MGTKLIPAIDGFSDEHRKFGNGFSEYGADLGRKCYNTLGGESRYGPIPVHIRIVPIDEGGYDPGGAYWGLGKPLWVAEFVVYEPETEQEFEGRTFARADTVEEAVEFVNKTWSTFAKNYLNEHGIDNMVTKLFDPEEGLENEQG